MRVLWEVGRSVDPGEAPPERSRGTSRAEAARRAGKASRQREQSLQCVTSEADKDRVQVPASVAGACEASGHRKVWSSENREED